MKEQMGQSEYIFDKNWCKYCKLVWSIHLATFKIKSFRETTPSKSHLYHLLSLAPGGAVIESFWWRQDGFPAHCWWRQAVGPEGRQSQKLSWNCIGWLLTGTQTIEKVTKCWRWGWQHLLLSYICTRLTHFQKLIKQTEDMDFTKPVIGFPCFHYMVPWSLLTVHPTPLIPQFTELVF